MRLLAILAAAAIALPTCSRDAPPEPGPAAPTSPANGGATEAAGIHYLERTTGGAAEGDRLPLVVAIHGLGDRPENFAPVLAGLHGRARLVVPRGLDPWQDGYSWFPMGSVADQAAFAQSIAAAADRIAAMIAAIARAKPTAGKPIVTGFSQGGMLSFALGVLHPDLVGAAFPVGGLLASPLLPASWPRGRAQPEIHAFHGVDDPLVPVARARSSVQGLRAIGLTVISPIPRRAAHDARRRAGRSLPRDRRGDRPRGAHRTLSGPR